jgi:hypothetical protein
MTLEELKEKLSRVDEITLMELLELTSYDIVELCEDKIEQKYDKMLRAVDDLY